MDVARLQALQVLHERANDEMLELGKQELLISELRERAADSKTRLDETNLAIEQLNVESQMMGGVIQSVSRSLTEGITFTKTRVTSTDWVTYPLLRFKDHPAVTTVVVQRPEVLPAGGGEPPAVPTPAAIANAFFDATGVRIRQAPMTPGRVRAVLRAAER